MYFIIVDDNAIILLNFTVCVSRSYETKTLIQLLVEIWKEEMIRWFKMFVTNIFQLFIN